MTTPLTSPFEGDILFNIVLISLGVTIRFDRRLQICLCNTILLTLYVYYTVILFQLHVCIYFFTCRFVSFVSHTDFLFFFFLFFLDIHFFLQLLPA